MPFRVSNHSKVGMTFTHNSFKSLFDLLKIWIVLNVQIWNIGLHNIVYSSKTHVCNWSHLLKKLFVYFGSSEQNSSRLNVNFSTVDRRQVGQIKCKVIWRSG